MSNSLVTKLKRHSMFHLLFSLKGNQKSCVLTEPLWGIPFNLYAPFVTIYMYNLGVNDVQIGILISIGLVVQLLASLFSGIITDKLGRKRTTFYFDFMCWSIPCLIWTFSQNFWWFLVAAIINGTWQITSTSWLCLLVEDTDQRQIPGMFNWIYISGLLAVFFAPIAGVMVARYSVVPTMRVLYFISFLSMSLKFIILYIFSWETKQGEVRMKETKGVPVWKMLAEYKDIFLMIMKSPDMKMCLVFMVIFNITGSVSSNFYSLLVTKTLNISESYLAYFPIVRALMIILLMFTVQPRLDRLPFKIPMLGGVVVYILSQLLLVGSIYGGFAMIALYVVFEGIAYAIVLPRKDSLVAMYVSPEERARIMSIMNVIMLGFSAPFGYIAGLLSNTNRTFPFVMNIILFVLVGIMIYRSKKLSVKAV